MKSSKSMLVLLAIGTVAGCSQAQQPSTVPLCIPFAIPLRAQAVYPIENATNVPDDAPVLVYAPFTYDPSPLPIAIGVGTASPLPIPPTSVPNPGPTPSEAPPTGAPEYAASLPALRPATTYQVYARLKDVPLCTNSQARGTIDELIDSFTTR